MTDSDDDFWKSQFDRAANMAFSWWDKAYDLLTAADVLDRFSGPVSKVFGPPPEGYPERLHYQQRSVVGVSGMLRAMATECLLKALWLHHGGKLAEAGEYLGMLRNEHHLDRLAKHLVTQKGLEFTERELRLLELASYWITSGRYPVQKDFSHLVPFEREDGTLAPAQYWYGHPYEELKALIKKLDGLLGFTMKFKDKST